MIQDIYPEIYSNAFEKRVPQAGDCLLIYEGGKALLSVTDGSIEFPILGTFPDVKAEDCRFLFRIGGRVFVLADALPDEIPSQYGWFSSGEYRNFRPMDCLFACAVGHSLFRWYRNNRYCGRCGCKMQDSRTERAVVCPDCGSTVYPKICPAVIVGVRNGNKLLVTRYKDRPYKGQALIAVFNEIGESIEDTVRREVMEEAGLKVRNLRFYKSQPWVITDSLLLGFYCDLDGKDEIRLQEDELSCAEWVDREALPEDFSHVSLTAEMIEKFRLGQD